jgi:ABC-type dipeptide/oligopeptide/nickel transport system permease subunit
MNIRDNWGALFGLGIVAVFALIALLAPWLAPFDPAQIHDGMFARPPVWGSSGQLGQSLSQVGNALHFWLGTDDVGRDLLSRLIFGARISIGVGLMVVVFSVSIGVCLGLFAGYFGGWVDILVMRLTDVLMALPSILLAIVVVTVLGQNLSNAIIAVGLTIVPGFIRLVRGQVMVEKNRQYVVASKTFGAGSMRQIFINILPNCVAPIIVQGTLSFSDGILQVAALGFLGLGARPPTAEWGTMLADARPFIESAPWMVTLPGLCIFLVVVGFNLLGDGLRDIFDPRLKR